jgi:hypothetical protein
MLETMVVDAENNAIDVESLCKEFGEVAERIQNEVSGEFGRLSDGDWAEVDRAERVVDECAEDLRLGRGERTIWLLALESYERIWSQVLSRKAGRQSLAA